MNRFTEEQVIQLAPDAASLKAGKSLASELKWLSLSYNERALWGEMQGSGKDPYRTIIDLNNIAFKCSCPSRKFPCKHGLGLLLVYTQKTETLSSTEPAWVQDWISKRLEKSENKNNDEETSENNPAKQEKQKKDKAKRQQDRMSKVQEGVAELDLWVRDLIRTGLISLPEKGHRFFEKTAARMVDSQAPGLANMVKSLGEINFYQGTSWQSQAFEQLSAIHLLTEAFNNLESLPQTLQEDVKTMIGWSVSQKELLERSDPEIISIKDNWLIAGRITKTEGDMTVQRNWLYGMNSGRYALIINFAYRNTPISTLLIPGTIIDAELVYSPSHAPLRAFIKEQGALQSHQEKLPFPVSGWKEMSVIFTERLSRNPWADDEPFYVEHLKLARFKSSWHLQDNEGFLMPVNRDFDEQNILNMLALTGGKKMNLFLLKTDSTVFPLGISENNIYQLL